MRVSHGHLRRRLARQRRRGRRRRWESPPQDSLSRLQTSKLPFLDVPRGVRVSYSIHHESVPFVLGFLFSARRDTYLWFSQRSHLLTLIFLDCIRKFKYLVYLDEARNFIVGSDVNARSKIAMFSAKYANVGHRVYREFYIILYAYSDLILLFVTLIILLFHVFIYLLFLLDFYIFYRFLILNTFRYRDDNEETSSC